LSASHNFTALSLHSFLYPLPTRKIADFLTLNDVSSLELPFAGGFTASLRSLKHIVQPIYEKTRIHELTIAINIALA